MGEKEIQKESEMAEKKAYLFNENKDYWDYYSTMKTAYKKGREEGLKEARKERREEERLESARKLKNNGVPLDIITRSLNLIEEETIDILSLATLRGLFSVLQITSLRFCPTAQISHRRQ